MRKRIIPITALLAAALLAGCSDTARTPPPGNGLAIEEEDGSIEIARFAYDPAELRIEPGTKVTWTNSDAIAHTVTSGEPADKGTPGVSEGSPPAPDGLFDEALAEEGATASFTFEEEGTFSYYCAIHQGMKAEVVVE